MFSSSKLLAFMLVAELASLALGASPLVLDLVENRPRNPTPGKIRLGRRDGPLYANTEEHTQDSYLYSVDVGIGTPAQTVKLAVAINSGDIVVITGQTQGCLSAGCSEFGTYNPNVSSTYVYRNSNFTTDYADKDNILGLVASETIRFGSTPITNVTVLVGNQGNRTQSVLGLGYNNLEVVTPKYRNLPMQMYDNGLTSIIGYSLYYNHSGAETGGRVIFGGIDTNKFYGRLETQPVKRPSSEADYQWATIKMSSISYYDGTKNNTITDSSINIVPDCGSAATYLPRSMVRDISNYLGCVDVQGYCVLTIGSYDKSASLNFTFGSTTVAVPLDDMVYPFNSTHSIVTLLTASSESENTLGLGFFKNAYVILDMTHNQLSLARLRHEPSADNITLIDENGAANMIGYVDEQSPLPPNTPLPTGSGGGLSTGAQAGIGAGVGGGALLLIAAGLFFWRKNKKSKKQQAGQETGVPTNPPVLTQEMKNPPPPSYIAYNPEYNKGGALSPQTRYSEPFSPTSDAGTFTTAGGASAGHDYPLRSSTASPPSELYGSQVDADRAGGVRRKPVPSELSSG